MFWCGKGDANYFVFLSAKGYFAVVHHVETCSKTDIHTEVIGSFLLGKSSSGLGQNTCIYSEILGNSCLLEYDRKI